MEIMEILDAYDLMGRYRAAAEPACCDHHTVARYTALQEAGEAPVTRELSSPMGWNARNELAHGFFEGVPRPLAALLIQAALYIATLQPGADKPRADDDQSS